MERVSDLLTVAEAQEICNIGRRTAYELVHAEGPDGWKPFTLRIGAGKNGLRVKRSALMRWIDARCGLVDPTDGLREETKEERSQLVDLVSRVKAGGGRRARG